MSPTISLSDGIPLLVTLVLLLPCWLEFWKRLKVSTLHGPECDPGIPAYMKAESNRSLQTELKMRPNADASKGEKQGVTADLWLELPLTMLISFCMVSAIGLIDGALRNTVPKIVFLPR